MAKLTGTTVESPGARLRSVGVKAPQTAPFVHERLGTNAPVPALVFLTTKFTLCVGPTGRFVCDPLSGVTATDVAADTVLTSYAPESAMVLSTVYFAKKSTRAVCADCGAVVKRTHLTAESFTGIVVGDAPTSEQELLTMAVPPQRRLKRNDADDAPEFLATKRTESSEFVGRPKACPAFGLAVIAIGTVADVVTIVLSASDTDGIDWLVAVSFTAPVATCPPVL